MNDTRPIIESGMEARKESDKQLAVHLLHEAKGRYASKIKALAARGRMGDGNRFIRWTTDGKPIITKL